MHSQVQYGKVRTPTDAWAGLGFSNSMPEAVITELVSPYIFTQQNNISRVVFG